MIDASLCAMGGMTPLPVLSALDHYADDFGLSGDSRKAPGSTEAPGASDASNPGHGSAAGR
jgi:hypothetical protein